MPDDLVVAPGVAIPRSELTVRATRSGGPGGQHVNTSATRVELIWNVDRTRAFADDARARIRARLATRLDADGNLRIVSSEFRSQNRNREAAEQRLATTIARALVVPKRRRKTRPTAASVRTRLESKRRHADKKRDRRARDDD